MTKHIKDIRPEAFRSYDVRGLYPSQVNEEMAFQVGQAFVNYLNGKQICVGWDSRPTSPKLAEAFIKGACQQGADVIVLGMIPSEVMYFAVGKYKFDGGAVITASHNPPEYNGIRIVDKGVEMISGKRLYGFIKEQKAFSDAKKEGSLKRKKVIRNFVDHVLGFVDLDRLKPLKLVIDAGNGTAGLVIPELFKNLPFDYIPLFFEPDGTFPNRPSNPLLPESQEKLRSAVLKEGADAGVIFDGDSDRVLLMTERGEFLKGDISLALMAKYLLKQEPGASFSFTLICSRIVSEKINEWGGQPIKTPVGFVNVSGSLRKNRGIMGGETSAHYCFRDNYYADSGMIALMLLLGIISDSDAKLSEVMKDFQKYIRKEVYFESDKVTEMLAELKERYSDGQQDEMDGLTVEYPDWWFNARPSNTEPLLRLTAEAENEKLLDEKINEITKIIENL